MANLDDLQKEHEARLNTLLAELAGRSRESDLALVRALIHRAVHLTAERRAAEFCTLATFLAEMVGHAHAVMHGNDPTNPAHGDVVH